MALELVVAGPGTPVVHRPAHDLESLFYVFVGVCVLFEHPHKMKKGDQASCFDKYFNSFRPSSTKTAVIQSDVGWAYSILPHISPYFRPLIPLLNKLRQRIIVPMRYLDDRLIHKGDEVTHQFMFDAFLDALRKLGDEGWVKVPPPPDTDDGPSPAPAPAPAPSPAPSPETSSSSDSYDPDDEGSSAVESVGCFFPRHIRRPSPLRDISGSGFGDSQYASSSNSNRRRYSNIDPSDLPTRSAKRPRRSPGPPSPRSRSRA